MEENNNRLDAATLAGQDGAIVLIDNSNVFIEGKKSYAKRLRLETEQDPLWRFDPSRLVAEVARAAEAEVAAAQLFCSCPRWPADMAWAESLDRNIAVDITLRSSNGREKQVDVKVSMMLTADANRQDMHRGLFGAWQAPNRRYIVISGDGDFAVAMRQALEFGLPVDVWSWKCGTSEATRQLGADFGDLCKLRYLDDIVEKFETLPAVFSTERRRFPAHSTLVVKFSSHDDQSAFNTFQQQCGFPVYLYAEGQWVYVVPHYDHSPQTVQTLFDRLQAFLMKNAPSASVMNLAVAKKAGEVPVTASPDVSSVFAPLFCEEDKPAPDSDESASEGHGSRCPSVHPDSGSENLDRDDLPYLEDHDNGCNDNDDCDDNEKWCTPSRKYDRQITKHRLHVLVRQRQRCHRREFCRQGSECQYWHSPSENSLFQSQSGHGYLRLKTALCTQQCVPGSRKREQCRYCHEDEKPLCTVCLRFGCSQDDQCHRIGESRDIVSRERIRMLRAARFVR
jgi:hypothetical protein